MMIKKILIALLLFSSLQAFPIITYKLNGGRLGDNLVAYLHAKWVSYKSGLPLSYVPFPFSDHFAFHGIERIHHSRTKQKNFTYLESIDKNFSGEYVVHYIPECEQEYWMTYKDKNYGPFFEVDWTDPSFLEIARSHLAPRFPVTLIDPPEDRISVALHVRRPVGQDAYSGEKDILIYKFVDDDFYINELKYVYELHGKKDLYVFVFTDEQAPNKIAEAYSAKLGASNIEFDYRRDNDPARHLFDDFYSMQHFDVLIRSESNFSIVAGRIGYQKMVISPELMQGGKVVKSKRYLKKV